jgi:hypothetical protein
LLYFVRGSDGCSSPTVTRKLTGDNIDPAIIGKLCSSFESGESYNNQIAVKRVLEALEVF